MQEQLPRYIAKRRDAQERCACRDDVQGGQLPREAE